ncbi:glycosyltransferase [Actinoalloteichus caeruleus]|uniref:glycosyltransferase n=1 Tax=Actinoalloteichus cyanogriseus TaxID=2893586 RepID=UPI003BB919CE
MRDGIEYADGAEDEVLTILRNARDVSAGSPELAAGVTSWETAYHLHPQRVGLLAPLRLRPGMRALDLGCGSGVLTRALAEAGLDVLGIEGEAPRAEAAEERCRDLDGARVVQGDVVSALAAEGQEGTADLAVLCGLVEHAVHQGTPPPDLLRATAAALAEDGVLALAIENQLGLGYLLGQPEPHHDRSYLGLADYPAAGFPGEGRGPRTWTRRVLGDMLRSAGLSAQRWLLPFPDYKLPRVILDERAYAGRGASDLADKLVRHPLLGAFGGGEVAAPARSLHRMAAAEGFGAATAPSFLVLAARSEEALARLVDPALGWIVTMGRLPEWRRVRRLDTDLVLRPVPDAAGLRPHADRTADGGQAPRWLRQRESGEEPWLTGAPLDRHILDSLNSGNLKQTTILLRGWRDAILHNARELADSDPRHPYLPGHPGKPVLPADFLDVHPGNFIIADDGGAHRIDREWVAGTGVDAELALLRALLEFAREITATGSAHPWGHGASIRDVLAELCGLVDLTSVLDERWFELLAAEEGFQEVVSGPRPPASAPLEQETSATAPVPVWSVAGGLPGVRATLDAHRKLLADFEEAHRRLAASDGDLDRTRTELAQLRDEFRRELGELENHLERVEEDREALLHRLAEATQQLDQVQERAAQLDQRFATALAELSDTVREASAAYAENERLLAAETEARQRLARTRSRLDKLESAGLVSLGHRYVWPALRAVRGTRDLVLGRGGEEPDGVLRRLHGYLPPAAQLAATRIRKQTRAARDAALHWDVRVPDEPVRVGRGQVVELSGWVAHADLPIRRVSLLVDGREHPVNYGYSRPDVHSALGAAGVPVSENTGLLVSVPLAPITAPASYQLCLRVELADGSRLYRDLPELRVAPGTGIRPVRAEWPVPAGSRVVVAMATYEPEPGFLAEQFDSLRAQTHQNWVCVIADDASSPAARASIRELIGGDERFVLVEHDENVGFYRNFERALSLVPADADAVAMCDQDDVWDSDKLQVLLAELEDPGVALAYADMRLVDQAGTVFADSFWNRRRNQWEDLASLLLLNTVTGGASLVRAELVRDGVLPFPPRHTVAFHDHWTALCALATGRIAFVDRPLQSYRQHDANVSGRREEDLDAVLPASDLRLVLSSLGVFGRLTDAQRELLDVGAANHLPALAQFAGTLLVRFRNELDERTRAQLVRLAGADRGAGGVLSLLQRSRKQPGQVAGVDRLLLGSALRRRAVTRSARRAAPRPPEPLD